MRIQLHPDGLLYVRESADAAQHLYAERLTLVEADLGVALTLPEGESYFVYDVEDERLRFFDSKGNAHPQEGRVPHAFSEGVLANLPALIAAKAQRDAPPPPTPEQLARIQRRADLAAEADADVLIDRLRTATPAQIETYIQNNVTDLPSARAILARLAVAVAYALGGGRDK